MAKNVLVVESKNDRLFLSAVINHLNCDIDIAEPILIEEEDYRLMNGLDSEKLKQALNDLKADIQKGVVENIGIVIDVDNQSEKDRIYFLNNCLLSVFPDAQPLQRVNEFARLNFGESDIRLACHFTGVDGVGELETVLKTIKSKDSAFADCLESWEACIKTQNKAISPKEFDKFWVSIYLRFDTCSRSERYQAERKCGMRGLEYIMANKKDIWNFEHFSLDNLKGFLQLFCQSKLV